MTECISGLSLFSNLAHHIGVDLCGMVYPSRIERLRDFYNHEYEMDVGNVAKERETLIDA